MISKVPMEDADGLMLNETIKAGDDTAMAGSEDCLHLAVFTPRVKNFYQRKSLHAITLRSHVFDHIKESLVFF